jgi:uncharacterized surface protein with fasciclin (FAS1) repeats
MKINSNFKKMMLLFLVTTLSISCNDDDSGTIAPKTIAEIAQSESDLSILVQALTITDLVGVLDGEGAYTVFAPTNAAFIAYLEANNYDNLAAVPEPALKEILLNHVLGTKLTSVTLPAAGYVKTLASGPVANTNLSMYVNKTSGVVLNGGTANKGASVDVNRANIDASNGTIHIVNSVIGLPTLVNHAIANPDFESLVGALTGAGQPDFVGTLSGTGPYTVFAPTDAAFSDLNEELVGGIAGVSATNLTKVLSYHVVSGNILAANLAAGPVTPILQPAQTFLVGLTGGAKITDANGRVSNIIATDVQATNGVVHVLDKVLLPNLN